MNKRGVTLIEVLLSIVIVAVASIATLTYFSHAKGGIGNTSNRRAALERARERLEQMLAANVSDITPPQDGAVYPVSCRVSSVCDSAPKPCQWVPAIINEQASVDDLGCQQIVSTVQWVDDPSAGTGVPPTVIYDVLAFDVKIGFVSDWNPNTDSPADDFHRVHIRTLRTP